MASKKGLIESELLLLQHRRGDPDALEKLTTLWERPLYYYVRRLVKSEEEAKDVSQDIWLTVFRKIRSVRDPVAFPAWLYQVARRHTASHFRRPSPHSPIPEDESAPELADGNSFDPSASLNAEELHWGLGQLSPHHSECIILHFLEGFTLEEVGAIVGAPVGTVESRIHYAKKALRELLSKEACGDEE